MDFYVKNYDFAGDFRSKRNWSELMYSEKFKAYNLLVFTA